MCHAMPCYGNIIKKYLQRCKLGGGESGFWAQESVVGTKGMVYFIQSLIEVLENIYFNSRAGWDMRPFPQKLIFSVTYMSHIRAWGVSGLWNERLLPHLLYCMP